MVSAINSLNQYSTDRELLEVVRRLQSLGVAPSGDLTIDRQRLQNAEYIKRHQTLATNSEINLAKLEGSGNDFSTMFETVQSINNFQKVSDITPNNGLINNINSGIAVDLGISSVSGENKEKLQYEMQGASQLAELNKLKLGLLN